MKKIFIAVLLLVTFLVSSPNKIAASEEAAIEINSIEDLINIKRNPGADYVLVRDLDFLDPDSYDDPNAIADTDINYDGRKTGLLEELTTGAGWEPIEMFRGDFDGQGHIIDNLYVNGRRNAALFGNIYGHLNYDFKVKVVDYASVKRLGLTNVYLTSYGFTGGIVVNASAAHISEVFVEGLLETKGNWVGGIAASTSNYSVVENTYTMGSIESIGYGTAAAGIVGSVFANSKIANNYTTASIKGYVTVSGISAQVLGGITINTANNIVFSDYIYGEYAVYRSVARSFGTDLSLFSRVDTRIENRNSSGGLIASFSPGSIDLDGGERYSAELYTLSNKYEGTYITYEDFADPLFYASTESIEVIDGQGTTKSAGWATGCRVESNIKCSELSENERLYFEVYPWDFETIWEIQEGGQRPTLQAFNQKDDASLPTPPIPGSDVTMSSDKFQGGDVITVSWNEAYLVVKKHRDGLMYDIYYSEGLNSDRSTWTLVGEDLLLSVKDGRASYTYDVPYDLDHPNLVFYIVAHDGVEETTPMYGAVFSIDNNYPEITAVTDSGDITENNKVINDPFHIDVSDATRVITNYTFNGETVEGNVYSSRQFTEDGEYVFTSVDSYGLSSTFTITIDTVKPVIEVMSGTDKVEDSLISTSDITVTSDSTFGLEYSLDGVSQGTFESGQVFTEDGLYEFVSTDEIGNTSEYSVIIDKHIPSATTTVTDDTMTLTFDETVVDYSFNGFEWMDVNSKTIDLILNSSQSKAYFRDVAGSVSQINFDSTQEEPSGISPLGTIGIVLGSISTIGGLAFVIVKFGFGKVSGV